MFKPNYCKSVGYILIALVSCMLVYSISRSDSATLSNFEFSENQFTFDTLTIGVTSEKSIRFRNRSKSVLNILSVRASCGCTSARAIKKKLSPGEETEIIVSLKGEVGTTVGEVGTVTIKTDIQNNSSIVVPVVVHALEGMNIVPTVLDFQYVNLTAKDSIQKKIYVVFNSKELDSESPIICTSSSSWFTIEKSTYSPERNETLFVVTVNPDSLSERGTFVDYIMVHALDSRQEILVSEMISVRIRAQ
ncbi:DUF1573 domain-containing protein [Gimesia sp.]|uniref:DUF1573 domain-containing protein n=1 Tax=Gimesia sp. TaxID=2024833 RepID=UPI003A8EF3DC